MSFINLNQHFESLMENEDMDVECEFYNVPDARIIDMLEEVRFDSE